jgi:hypothetical protein
LGNWARNDCTARGPLRNAASYEPAARVSEDRASGFGTLGDFAGTACAHTERGASGQNAAEVKTARQAEWKNGLSISAFQCKVLERGRNAILRTPRGSMVGTQTLGAGSLARRELS